MNRLPLLLVLSFFSFLFLASFSSAVITFTGGSNITLTGTGSTNISEIYTQINNESLLDSLGNGIYVLNYPLYAATGSITIHLTNADGLGWLR